MMRILVLLTALLSFQTTLFAQQYNLVLDNFQYNLIDKSMNALGSNQHTAVKPWRMEDIRKSINPDTAAGVKPETSRV